MRPSAAERTAWNQHWLRLTGEHRWVGAIADATRKILLSRALCHYAERYFPAAGWYLEAGCGTAGSSLRMRREGRRLVGLDLSPVALAQARQRGVFDVLVCGDVRRLPFRDGSLSGIWNLGVMEHFEAGVGKRILREFRRVLRVDGRMLLFWPPTFGLSRWVLAPVEWFKSRRSGRRFRFFPDEVHRLPSFSAARSVLREAELDALRLDFTPRDGFNHIVVVARRGEG